VKRFNGQERIGGIALYDEDFDFGTSPDVPSGPFSTL
jgi:hypothetical protein